jgi:hypothetical protein
VLPWIRRQCAGACTRRGRRASPRSAVPRREVGTSSSGEGMFTVNPSVAVHHRHRTQRPARSCMTCNKCGPNAARPPLTNSPHAGKFMYSRLRQIQNHKAEVHLKAYRSPRRRAFTRIVWADGRFICPNPGKKRVNAPPRLRWNRPSNGTFHVSQCGIRRFTRAAGRSGRRSAR